MGSAAALLLLFAGFFAVAIDSDDNTDTDPDSL